MESVINLELAKIASLTHNAVVITDKNRKIRWVNTGFTRLSGYSLEEVYGKTPKEFLHGPQTDDTLLYHIHQKLAKGEGVENIELLNYTKNKQPYWINLEIKPIFNENKEIYQYMAIIIDITNQKNTLNAVSAYKKALEQSAIVFYSDIEGFITEANEKYFSYFGLPNLKKCNFRCKSLWEEKSERPVYDSMLPILMKGNVWKNKIQVFTSKEEECWWDITIIPFLDDELKPFQFLHICFDISLQQKFNREQEKAFRKEKELSELKSSFITTVSHEFRTPLTVIQSSIELINDMVVTKTEEDKQIYANLQSKIKTALTRMENLLDDIGFLGDIKDSNIKFNPQKINFPAYIHNILNKYYKTHPLGSKIQLQVKNGIPQISIDPFLFSHIVINLLNNAIKYTSSGKPPEIIIEERNNKLIFIIQDYGIGIPEDEIKKIFDNFYRAKNSNQYSGNGIGLSIVKEMVRLHNGKITCKSKLGDGSLFIIKLPIK
ncbi:MAG: PAS domain-containing protein [Leptospiraceae bacterium]|nr:PAS domain-containing protein [Leptospiraceae bacterium]